MSATFDNRVKLSDGRTLGYAEYGDPSGKPVIHFHGVPSSRFELSHPAIGETAEQLHVRLIVPDRPGFGLTDFKPNRTLLDWPDEVVELALALCLERFAVVGLSGGGPYVAACAYKIPRLLTSAGIISGIGPVDAPGALDGMNRSDRVQIRLARNAPWLLGILLRYAASSVSRHPDKLIAQLMNDLPEPDKAAMDDPEAQRTMERMLAAAFEQGTRGATWDMVLCSRPWGFPLEEIGTSVLLWHGEQDNMCPVAMGRHLAEAIPGCRATFYPHDGHLSIVRRYGEFLSAVAH